MTADLAREIAAALPHQQRRALLMLRRMNSLIRHDSGYWRAAGKISRQISNGTIVGLQAAGLIVIALPNHHRRHARAAVTPLGGAVTLEIDRIAP